jgi:tRNA nucleotidyltransferase/poly(A) polymerase
VADLPVPGAELSDSARSDEAAIAAAVPAAVHAILGTLWSNGQAAYVVGGGPRDVLAGRTPASSWDLATSALPEETATLLADAVYENRFGTVVVRRDGVDHEITTFRSDHDYADFRRPHRVEFTGSIEADLARRDFAMNALAWGAEASREAGAEAPRLLDLHSGRADIAARLIRAVGEPRARFEEDALRILRAIRFAATLGFTIEPATLEAIHATAPLVAHLSGERIAMELTRILAAERPSDGLRLLAATGVVAAISPELAAQRGVPQSKIAGEDLWDHTLRTVDAASARPLAEEPRWAALLHDIGKPATAADGHFYRHDSVGADQAGDLLDRLHVARATRERIVHLVRQHMFRYEPNWSDAAVRRFLAKAGPAAVEDLFALREADNAGSGLPPDAEDLTVLRERVAAELARGPLLDRTALAIDGRDLISELGLAEGPGLGRVIDALFERVVEDPALNERGRLLDLAREIVAGDTLG